MQNQTFRACIAHRNALHHACIAAHEIQGKSSSIHQKPPEPAVFVAVSEGEVSRA